jgi:hypothetical protein
MTTTTLKKKIHKYVDSSDDRILKVVCTILEEHSKLKTKIETGLTAKDIEDLDHRWDNYKKGKAKTYTILEVKQEVSNKLKAIKH